jgi:ribose transport system substrate-binding protein
LSYFKFFYGCPKRLVNCGFKFGSFPKKIGRRKGMKRFVSGILVLVACASIVMLASCGNQAGGGTTTTAAAVEKKELRFVMIPILSQAWFDIVYNASVDAANKLSAETGYKITIDYQAPATADPVVQNELLERVIATQPDGIAIDCTDINVTIPILEEAQSRGIPVILYASTAPPGKLIPHVGNNYYEQGAREGEELVQRLNGRGKVAIIHGVPTNPPHAERFAALKDVFAKYPGIQVVAEAFDYDDIENAQREAAAILSAHADLAGFAVCDAAGPVGVGVALKEAGKKPGEVKYVGIDDLPQLQELMREGYLDLSVATQPNGIGRWCVISLLMQNLGFRPITFYDTKYALLTPDLVKDGVIEGF